MSYMQVMEIASVGRMVTGDCRVRVWVDRDRNEGGCTPITGSGTWKRESERERERSEREREREREDKRDTN